MHRAWTGGLLSLMLVASAGQARTPGPADLAAANNAFAWDLYRQIAGREGNLFFSPFSMEVALAMTMAGARGETAQQMQQTSRLAGEGSALHAAVAGWQSSVLPAADDSLYTFTMANRLWGQAGLAFAPEFRRVTREDYGAEIGEVDFRNDAAAAREEINAWVTEQTRGRITELIPAGALDDQTRLVLTNAVYFLGSWRETFAKDATTDQPFFTGTREVVAPLMTQQTRFRYAEDDDVQVLELPYQAQGDGGLSMVIVLPRERDDLARISASLSSATYAAWIAGLQRRLVQVHLPRFEMSSALSLATVLADLGMPLAFTEGADFSGMVAGGARLVISDVLHEGFVKVDEKGTEAAAATGMVMGITSAPPPENPVVFRADHPFLFVIREQTTGTILFVGRLVDPGL